MTMKYFYTLILFFALSNCALFAQRHTGNAAIETISKSAAKINTMQCDFVQTKTLRMLNDEIVSHGRLSYQKTDKLRWEYASPYKYVFVLNGAQVLIKKGERADKIDINQSKVFKEIARIMMNTVMGKALSSQRDFKTTISATGTEYVAVMIPQRKDMRKMFKQIKLHFNKKAEMVQKIELTEQNGDTTRIELKNVKKNAPISASTFHVN